MITGNSSPWIDRCAGLQQFSDEGRCTFGAVMRYGGVVDVASDLGGDRLCDLVRSVEAEVHYAAGAVALEPVAYVEVLLEVIGAAES